MDNIKFSFIIPIYNVNKILVRKCLSSIYEQTYNNIEIIIINDGSNQDIGENYLVELNKKDNIKYITQKNMGVSVARNIGIMLSTGDYLIFVDPDDYVDRNLCSKIYNYLINHTNKIDLLLFKYTKEKKNLSLESNSNNFLNINYNQMKLNILNQYEPYEGYSLGAPWGKVFKRSFINKYKLNFEPNVNKSQDRLFMLYLLEKKPKIANVDYIGYFYNNNSNSISNKYNPNIKKIMDKTLYEMKKYIKKYHDGDYHYAQAYFNLCIQYFLLILRLDIYNSNNQEDAIYRKKRLQQIISDNPYKTAFDRVKLHNLGLRRKFIVLAVRFHFVNIIKFII